MHTLKCDCGCETTGQLPQGITTSQFGPRIHALHTWLRTDMRASLKRTQEFFADVIGLNLSKGAISAMDKRVSARLAPIHQQLGQAISDASVKHCDETTWYLNGDRRTLWTASNKQMTYMLISDKRDAASCQKLIGEEVKGTIITDRYCAYHYVDAAQRQMCWAHLLRDFTAMSERSEPMARCGRLLEDYTRELLKEYAKSRDGTQEQWMLFVKKWESKKGVISSFLKTAASEKGKYGGMAREILKREQSLWTFLEHRDVEPTNNLAERTLRHGAILRKTSYGSRSDEGLRFIERALSIKQTLVSQKRSFFKFLLQGQPRPILPA